MKIFSYLFLFCLAQIVFSKTEDYYIQPNGPLVANDCFQDQEGNYKYGFYFSAMTSGFPLGDKFYITLDEPKHAFVECIVNPVTEETVQLIACNAQAAFFPLFDIRSIVVPSVINLEKEKQYIQIENWKGGEVELHEACYLPFTYEFTQNKDEIFTVIDLADGYDTKTLSGYGSFQPVYTNNKLTSTDYIIRPSVILDNEYKNIDCTISPANSGEDLIECTFTGKDRVIFFPTMAIEKNLGEYVRFNVEQEVSLYGSFIKLSSILLLSLLLF